MGRGGPQPAYQTRADDLHTRAGASADVDDAQTHLLGQAVDQFLVLHHYAVIDHDVGASITTVEDDGEERDNVETNISMDEEEVDLAPPGYQADDANSQPHTASGIQFPGSQDLFEASSGPNALDQNANALTGSTEDPNKSSVDTHGDTGARQSQTGETKPELSEHGVHGPEGVEIYCMDIATHEDPKKGMDHDEQSTKLDLTLPENKEALNLSPSAAHRNASPKHGSFFKDAERAENNDKGLPEMTSPIELDGCNDDTIELDKQLPVRRPPTPSPHSFFFSGEHVTDGMSPNLRDIADMQPFVKINDTERIPEKLSLATRITTLSPPPTIPNAGYTLENTILYDGDFTNESTVSARIGAQERDKSHGKYDISDTASGQRYTSYKSEPVIEPNEASQQSPYLDRAKLSTSGCEHHVSITDDQRDAAGFDLIHDCIPQATPSNICIEANAPSLDYSAPYEECDQESNRDTDLLDDCDGVKDDFDLAIDSAMVIGENSYNDAVSVSVKLDSALATDRSDTTLASACSNYVTRPGVTETALCSEGANKEPATDDVIMASCMRFEPPTSYDLDSIIAKIDATLSSDVRATNKDAARHKPLQNLNLPSVTLYEEAPGNSGYPNIDMLQPRSHENSVTHNSDNGQCVFTSTPKSAIADMRESLGIKTSEPLTERTASPGQEHHFLNLNKEAEGASFVPNNKPTQPELNEETTPPKEGGSHEYKLCETKELTHNCTSLGDITHSLELNFDEKTAYHMSDGVPDIEVKLQGCDNDNAGQFGSSSNVQTLPLPTQFHEIRNFPIFATVSTEAKESSLKYTLQIEKLSVETSSTGIEVMGAIPAAELAPEPISPSPMVEMTVSKMDSLTSSMESAPTAGSKKGVLRHGGKTTGDASLKTKPRVTFQIESSGGNKQVMCNRSKDNVFFGKCQTDIVCEDNCDMALNEVGAAQAYGAAESSDVGEFKTSETNYVEMCEDDNTTEDDRITTVEDDGPDPANIEGTGEPKVADDTSLEIDIMEFENSEGAIATPGERIKDISHLEPTGAAHGKIRAENEETLTEGVCRSTMSDAEEVSLQRMSSIESLPQDEDDDADLEQHFSPTEKSSQANSFKLERCQDIFQEEPGYELYMSKAEEDESKQNRVFKEQSIDIENHVDVRSNTQQDSTAESNVGDNSIVQEGFTANSDQDIGTFSSHMRETIEDVNFTAANKGYHSHAGLHTAGAFRSKSEHAPFSKKHVKSTPQSEGDAGRSIATGIPTNTTQAVDNMSGKECNLVSVSATETDAVGMASPLHIMDQISGGNPEHKSCSHDQRMKRTKTDTLNLEESSREPILSVDMHRSNNGAALELKLDEAQVDADVSESSKDATLVASVHWGRTTDEIRTYATEFASLTSGELSGDGPHTADRGTEEKSNEKNTARPTSVINSVLLKTQSENDLTIQETVITHHSEPIMETSLICSDPRKGTIKEEGLESNLTTVSESSTSVWGGSLGRTRSSVTSPSQETEATQKRQSKTSDSNCPMEIWIVPPDESGSQPDQPSQVILMDYSSEISKRSQNADATLDTAQASSSQENTSRLQFSKSISQISQFDNTHLDQSSLDASMYDEGIQCTGKSLLSEGDCDKRLSERMESQVFVLGDESKKSSTSVSMNPSSDETSSSSLTQNASRVTFILPTDSKQRRSRAQSVPGRKYRSGSTFHPRTRPKSVSPNRYRRREYGSEHKIVGAAQRLSLSTKTLRLQDNEDVEKYPAPADGSRLSKNSLTSLVMVASASMQIDSSSFMGYFNSERAPQMNPQPTAGENTTSADDATVADKVPNSNSSISQADTDDQKTYATTIDSFHSQTEEFISTVSHLSNEENDSSPLPLPPKKDQTNKNLQKESNTVQPKGNLGNSQVLVKIKPTLPSKQNVHATLAENSPDLQPSNFSTSSKLEYDPQEISLPEDDRSAWFRYRKQFRDLFTPSSVRDIDDSLRLRSEDATENVDALSLDSSVQSKLSVPPSKHNSPSHYETKMPGVHNKLGAPVIADVSVSQSRSFPKANEPHMLSSASDTHLDSRAISLPKDDNQGWFAYRKQFSDFFTSHAREPNLNQERPPISEIPREDDPCIGGTLELRQVLSKTNVSRTEKERHPMAQDYNMETSTLLDSKISQITTQGELLAVLSDQVEASNAHVKSAAEESSTLYHTEASPIPIPVAQQVTPNDQVVSHLGDTVDRVPDLSQKDHSTEILKLAEPTALKSPERYYQRNIQFEDKELQKLKEDDAHWFSYRKKWSNIFSSEGEKSRNTDHTQYFVNKNKHRLAMLSEERTEKSGVSGSEITSEMCQGASALEENIGDQPGMGDGVGKKSSCVSCDDQKVDTTVRNKKSKLPAITPNRNAIVGVVIQASSSVSELPAAHTPVTTRSGNARASPALSTRDDSLERSRPPLPSPRHSASPRERSVPRVRRSLRSNHNFHSLSIHDALVGPTTEGSSPPVRSVSYFNQQFVPLPDIQAVPSMAATSESQTSVSSGSFSVGPDATRSPSARRKNRSKRAVSRRSRKESSPQRQALGLGPISETGVLPPSAFTVTDDTTERDRLDEAAGGVEEGPLMCDDNILPCKDVSSSGQSEGPAKRLKEQYASAGDMEASNCIGGGDDASAVEETIAGLLNPVLPGAPRPAVVTDGRIMAVTNKEKKYSNAGDFLRKEIPRRSEQQTFDQRSFKLEKVEDVGVSSWESAITEHMSHIVTSAQRSQRPSYVPTPKRQSLVNQKIRMKEEKLKQERLQRIASRKLRAARRMEAAYSQLTFGRAAGDTQSRSQFDAGTSQESSDGTKAGGDKSKRKRSQPKKTRDEKLQSGNTETEMERRRTTGDKAGTAGNRSTSGPRKNMGAATGAGGGGSGGHRSPSGAPQTRRKVSRARVAPNKVLADGHYDRGSNVINVVVKPVNIDMDKEQFHLKVQVHRKQAQDALVPRPPSQEKPAQGNQTKRKIKLRRPPPCPLPVLASNIVELRAINPPFNLTMTTEADKRFQSIYGRCKVL